MGVTYIGRSGTQHDFPIGISDDIVKKAIGEDYISPDSGGLRLEFPDNMSEDIRTKIIQSHTKPLLPEGAAPALDLAKPENRPNTYTEGQGFLTDVAEGFQAAVNIPQNYAASALSAFPGGEKPFSPKTAVEKNQRVFEREIQEGKAFAERDKPRYEERERIRVGEEEKFKKNQLNPYSQYQMSPATPPEMPPEQRAQLKEAIYEALGDFGISAVSGGTSALVKGAGSLLRGAGGVAKKGIEGAMGYTTMQPVENLKALADPVQRKAIEETVLNKGDIAKDLYKKTYEVETPEDIANALSKRTSEEGVVHTKAAQDVEGLNKAIQKETDAFEQAKIKREQDDALSIKSLEEQKSKLFEEEGEFGKKAVSTLEKVYKPTTIPKMKTMEKAVAGVLESAKPINAETTIKAIENSKIQGIEADVFNERLQKFADGLRAKYTRKADLAIGVQPKFLTGVEAREFRKELDNISAFDDISRRDDLSNAMKAGAAQLRKDLVEASPPKYKKLMGKYHDMYDAQSDIRKLLTGKLDVKEANANQILINLGNPKKPEVLNYLKNWDKQFDDNLYETATKAWKIDKAKTSAVMTLPPVKSRELTTKLSEAEDVLKKTAEPGAFEKEWDVAVKTSDRGKREKMIERVAPEFQPMFKFFHNELIKLDDFKQGIIGKVKPGSPAKIAVEKALSKMGGMEAKEQRRIIEALDKKYPDLNLAEKAKQLQIGEESLTKTTTKQGDSEITELTIPFMGRKPMMMAAEGGISSLFNQAVRMVSSTAFGPKTSVNVVLPLMSKIEKAYKVGAIPAKYLVEAGGKSGDVGMKIGILVTTLRVLNNLSNSQQTKLDNQLKAMEKANPRQKQIISDSISTTLNLK